MQVAYSKVSESKNQKRIWIEGGRLLAAGFSYGEAFDVIESDDRKSIRIELSLFGERRVSGRKRQGEQNKTPIIDLCSMSITNFVGDCEKVRVSIFEGFILIELHHEYLNRISREESFRSNRKGNSLSTGTLCAGGGISTAAVHDGLLSNGVKSDTKWCVDIVNKYLEVADRNNHAITSSTKLIVGAIEELRHDDLSPVNILNVSLPCDIHAKCGKAKKGHSVAEEVDSITSMVGLFAKIRSTNPAIIISENVVEAKNSASYMMLISELNRTGYIVHEAILNEEIGGSIERRRRYWFVAVSVGLIAEPIHNLEAYAKSYRSVSECLEADSVTDGRYKDYTYLKVKEDRDLADGKFFKQQLVSADASSVGTSGKFYAKGRSTEARLLRSDGKSRLFTVKEACRMKLIPEHLLDGCLFTLGHEIQGQSILYGHGWSLGRYVSNIQ